MCLLSCSWGCVCPLRTHVCSTRSRIARQEQQLRHSSSPSLTVRFFHTHLTSTNTELPHRRHPHPPHVLNAVILSSAWSAGNAFFYSSTRILYAAAIDGKAPKLFAFERHGVPYVCVAMTSAVAMLAYLVVGSTSSEVFFWLSNISAVSTLMVWGSIVSRMCGFMLG